MTNGFRVWDKDEKCMLYDSDFIYVNSMGEIIYVDWDNQNKIHKCSNCIIQYYSGKNDCDGKKIYNGDNVVYLCLPDESHQVEYTDGSMKLGNIFEGNAIAKNIC